jgi:recombination protein RecR
VAWEAWAYPGCDPDLFAGPIQKLIDELARLPGIGPKSAQRVAFYLLKLRPEDANRLAEAIVEVKAKVRLCSLCFNVSDQELCEYCRDSRRDPSVVCVVQEPPDIVAIERTREFHGLYHVLQGAISPIEGIGPEELRIAELLDRLKRREGSVAVTELIVATNPNVEGEATAMYIARLTAPLGIKVTRLASGLPVGGDLEYADEVTLGRALEGRRLIEG